MDIHLDPGIVPLIRLALSLGLCAMSAQLAFAWLEMLPGTSLTARLSRLVGAGFSLGTGIWMTHDVAASGAPLGAEISIWLVAVAAAIASLAWSEHLGTNRSQQQFATSAV